MCCGLLLFDFCMFMLLLYQSTNFFRFLHAFCRLPNIIITNAQLITNLRNY